MNIGTFIVVGDPDGFNYLKPGSTSTNIFSVVPRPWGSTVAATLASLMITALAGS